MGAIADDRPTEALESFERGVDVENGLGTGADQDDGVLGEREQVGGLVEVLLSTVVHARSEEHTLNSSHVAISYAVFCLKKKKKSIKKKDVCDNNKRSNKRR